MSDPKAAAAERARRYRARQRETAETVGSVAVVELLRELVAAVDRLGITLRERDEGVTFGRARDVTVPSRATDDAHGPARVGTEPEPLRGSRALGAERDAFAHGVTHGRILAALDTRDAAGMRIASTVAAIADAADLGQQETIRGLIELRELGAVARLAGLDAHSRDRWQLVESSPPPTTDQIGLDERGLQA